MAKRNFINDTDRRRADQLSTRLSNVNLDGAEAFGADVLDVINFEEWREAAQEVVDPDVARTALYYGFQPLYDALIGDTLQGDARASALKTLDRLVQFGSAFLLSYYQGEPDMRLFREGTASLDGELALMDGTPYQTKHRNIDSNHIYPRDIQHFMLSYLTHVAEGKTPMPQTVVGCACGSSEIVMPFAAMINANLYMIRRSWRRGDDSPRIVSEHRDTIAKGVKGKHVVAVEDYVCSGYSLRRVMEYAFERSPTHLIGASLNCVGMHALNHKVSKSKFHLYTLGRR